MNFREKVEKMKEDIDLCEESLFEHECQYQSECAMFGDAGVGQHNTIQHIRSLLQNKKAELNRIMSTPAGKALQVVFKKEHDEYMKKLDADIPF